MNAFGFRSLLRGLPAALALMGAAASSIAVSGGVQTVVVHDDGYVWADRAFDDLNRLASALRRSAPREVLFELCTDGTARALKAAIHRFQDLPLQTRIRAPADKACARPKGAVVPVARRTGQPPHGIDEAAVDRYWRELGP
jgi:hypothetical protein